MKTFLAKRIIPLFSVLTMVLTAFTAVTVSAAPDFTKDYAKTFVDQDSTKRADDNLIKNTAGNEDCYMLWSPVDISGRNHPAVNSAQAAGVVDYDGKTRNMLQFTVSDKNPDASGVINGLLFAKDGAARTYYNPSDIKDGDKLVVSIYVKTKNAGTTTRFNMGFQNGVNYGYNTFTDTYGEEGMEVTDEWKRFTGIITIPNGYESAIETAQYYCLTMGYPGKMSGTMEEMLVSNAYLAKAKAVDIKTSAEKLSTSPGSTFNVSAEILNQLGTTNGISQDVTWYITDESRENIVTDGFAVSKDGEIAIADDAECGNYCAVAVSDADETMVSGVSFKVEDKLDISKDYAKTFKESDSTAQAEDSLIRVKEGQTSAYMLKNANDINGRNSAFVDTNSAESVTYFDGKTGSSTIIKQHASASSDTTDANSAIHGTSLGTAESSGNTPRAWFDKSSLKPGDKIVVSIYAKTSEAGKTTKFNLALSKNNVPATTAFTDTYGSAGMEVTDEWKKFAGVITVPSDFTTDNAYTLHFGFAQNTKIENMNVSCLYAAKAKAVDIKTELSKETAAPGETVAASAEILNQIGTTNGISQDVAWYVANEARTEILENSGITVSDDGTVAVSEGTPYGTYNIIAVSNADKKLVSGTKLTVESPECEITFEKTGSGSVSCGKTQLEPGANTVEYGNSEFTFTPDEGWEISSVEFGGSAIPVTNKDGFTSIISVSEAGTLKVVFAQKAIAKPAVSSDTPIFAANYDYSAFVPGAAPSNAILGYATLDLGYGYTVSECGYILKNSDGKSIELPAVAIPENGGKYGIRAVGAALTDGTYAFTPYVKLSDGTVIYGAEQSVEIK